MKKVLKSIYRFLPFKKELYLGLKKIWVPPERIYRHLHFTGLFRVSVDAQKSFVMRHYGYQIENEIFWKGLTGGWEKTSMGLWISLCRRSSVIFDVGANTGIYSLAAKAVQPTSIVYAFEPVKRVYSKLIENSRLNGFDIVCLDQAASNTDGQALIYDNGADHVLSVTVNKDTNPPGGDSFPVTVNTVRLSSVIEKNNLQKVDLIKIDVETHEPEVLEGLGPFLSQDRPTLLIEVLNDDIARKIERLVHGKDYLYFNIGEDTGVHRTNTILQSDFYNYLLCQKNTAYELGLIS